MLNPSNVHEYARIGEKNRHKKKVETEIIHSCTRICLVDSEFIDQGVTPLPVLPVV